MVVHRGPGQPLGRQGLKPITDVLGRDEVGGLIEVSALQEPADVVPQPEVHARRSILLLASSQEPVPHLPDRHPIDQLLVGVPNGQDVGQGGLVGGLPELAPHLQLPRGQVVGGGNLSLPSDLLVKPLGVGHGVLMETEGPVPSAPG